MALLSAAVPAFRRRMEGRNRPPWLRAVEDWERSSCVDPDRWPSPEIAPNWSREPGTLCGSCSTCRPEQRTPTGTDWDVWLYLAGRGAGKTRSAAEDMARAAAVNLRWRIAVLAPTYADARDTCVEGESGLISVLTRWGWEDGREYVWNRSLGELVFRDSRSRFKLYSAEKPARLRGPQHHRAWVEELAQVARHAADAWDMLKFGLRLGAHPQVVATTTPLPVTVIKQLITDPRCAVSRGTTDDNAANLPAITLRELHKKYDGTRLGEQELGGKLLDDIPGALWKRSWFDLWRIRVEEVPGSHEVEAVRDLRRALAQAALDELGITLVRVVVAVDPAVTSGDDADETGIVVAALATDGHIYVLEDASLRATPDEVMARVIEVHDAWAANLVVLEVNNGGEYIPSMLRAALKAKDRDPYSIATDTVHAKKGKRVRAEPVSNLYAPRGPKPGKVRHVGTLGHLEDQMCTWEPALVESPDRMDADVYAVLYLDDSGDGSALMTPKGSVSRHQGGPARMQMPTSSVRR